MRRVTLPRLAVVSLSGGMDSCVTAAIAPVAFAEPEDARFIQEHPANRAHIEQPQFSHLLWRVVPLKSNNPC